MLSQHAIAQEGHWDALQKEGQTWRGQIQSVNKGGVVVDVNGLRGFIPLSRLSPDRLQALDRQENQTGQPIAAKIIQVSICIICQAVAARIFPFSTGSPHGIMFTGDKSAYTAWPDGPHPQL